jgi:hypothetical protein
MSFIKSVYILKPVLSDARYDGCVIGRGAKSVLGSSEAYDDLCVENPMSVSWRPKSLAKHWKPMPVLGPKFAFNDYPCLELNNPVFSHRAVDAFAEMLSENGEVLPLKSKIGNYFLYNITTKIEALDVKKSKIRRSKSTETAGWIDYYWFKSSKLAGATIFRIAEEHNVYFVTERFKKRAVEAKLNGLQFYKVWPLKEGENWDNRPRKDLKVPVQGEGLTLSFSVTKVGPTPTEKKVCELLESSLHTLLQVKSSRQKYWGSIERTEFVKGKWQVVISCPDSGGLLRFLTPYLGRFEWEGDIVAIKRFGNLYDGPAKEDKITLFKN